MGKLSIVRGSVPPRQVESYNYITWRQQHHLCVHQEIALPDVDVVTMLHRLMLTVQSRVRPHVTWTVHDSWIRHAITLDWYGCDSQVRLEMVAGHLGVHGWLWPVLAHNYTDVEPLARWTAQRDSNWTDYGQLNVYRSEGTGRTFRMTDLRCTDPLFDGIPRYVRPGRYSWQSQLEPPQPLELVDDIVATTHLWLVAAGIA